MLFISRIIYERFKEICPDEDISNKSIDELAWDCHIAFEIIGYEPKNLDGTVRRIHEKSDKDTRLFNFIYKVWRSDS